MYGFLFFSEMDEGTGFVENQVSYFIFKYIHWANVCYWMYLQSINMSLKNIHITIVVIFCHGREEVRPGLVYYCKDIKKQNYDSHSLSSKSTL